MKRPTIVGLLTEIRDAIREQTVKHDAWIAEMRGATEPAPHVDTGVPLYETDEP